MVTTMPLSATSGFNELDLGSRLNNQTYDPWDNDIGEAAMRLVERIG